MKIYIKFNHRIIGHVGWYWIKIIIFEMFDIHCIVCFFYRSDLISRLLFDWKRKDYDRSRESSDDFLLDRTLPLDIQYCVLSNYVVVFLLLFQDTIEIWVNIQTNQGQSGRKRKIHTPTTVLIIKEEIRDKITCEIRTSSFFFLEKKTPINIENNNNICSTTLMPSCLT